jgi:predicted Zn-dependent protease
MDIYMMGHFKNLNERDLTEIRDEQALWFADRIKPGVTLADMQKTQIDGCEALSFESPAPMKGRQWRQWALVKNQQAFVIVSAVSNENEKELMPDVRSMITSFHVLKPTDPYPGF